MECHYEKLINLAKEIPETPPKKIDPEALYTQYFSSNEPLYKYKFDDRKFPNLSDLGIREVLNGESPANIIEEYLKWHQGQRQNSNPLEQNPLAAFMAAFIWKQGDWQAFTHQLNGFLGIQREKENSLVIYNFGKHLKNPVHPIVDQHTVRAYLLLNCDRSWITECESLDAFQKWSSTKYVPKGIYKILDGDLLSTGLEQCFVKDFYKWCSGLSDKNGGKDGATPDAVDRLLFCFGKASKKLRQAGGKRAQ